MCNDINIWRHEVDLLTKQNKLLQEQNQELRKLLSDKNEEKV